MYCISFNDIIELNGLLKDQGLHFRIHLRDACGNPVGSNRLGIVHVKDILMKCIRFWRIFLQEKEPRSSMMRVN